MMLGRAGRSAPTLCDTQEQLASSGGGGGGGGGECCKPAGTVSGGGGDTASVCVLSLSCVSHCCALF